MTQENDTVEVEATKVPNRLLFNLHQDLGLAIAILSREGNESIARELAGSLEMLESYVEFDSEECSSK